MVCEISQPKVVCENRLSLRKNFAALKSRCENHLPLRRDPLAHECHFAAAKWLRNLHALKSSTSQPRRHFKGCFAAAKPPFGTRVPLRSIVRPFCSCEMGYENDAEIPLAAKTLSHCEIHDSSLQKTPLLRKGTVTLGVLFKWYKFHFSYFKPSFELQK